jgi:hypothetical protein
MGAALLAKVVKFAFHQLPFSLNNNTTLSGRSPRPFGLFLLFLCGIDQLDLQPEISNTDFWGSISSEFL